MDLGLNMGDMLGDTAPQPLPPTRAAFVDYASVARIIYANIQRQRDENVGRINDESKQYHEAAARYPARAALYLEEAKRVEAFWTERYNAVMGRWRFINFDEYLTRLGLISGLTKVWGDDHPKVPFEIAPVPHLCAITDDVIAVHQGYDRRTDHDTTERWSLGEYLILLPLGASKDQIHFVPMRDPKNPTRHPHHLLISGRSRTCFDQFGTAFETALKSGDAAVLLNLSTKFVHDYNPAHHLATLGQIPFKRRLP